MPTGSRISCFNFYMRKLLDDLLPPGHGSPHNQKSVKNNSPESNVKGKNLCNLTTAEKLTSF